MNERKNRWSGPFECKIGNIWVRLGQNDFWISKLYFYIPIKKTIFLFIKYSKMNVAYIAKYFPKTGKSYRTK